MNTNLSLNQIKSLISKYKLVVVVTTVLLLVLLIWSVVNLTTQKPPTAIKFTKTAGSPNLAKEGKILFTVPAPTQPSQPQTTILTHQPPTVTAADAQKKAVEFGFEQKATRTVGSLNIWSNKNESLEIDLNNKKLIYRKNLFTNPTTSKNICGNKSIK